MQPAPPTKFPGKASIQRQHFRGVVGLWENGVHPTSNKTLCGSFCFYNLVLIRESAGFDLPKNMTELCVRVVSRV